MISNVLDKLFLKKSNAEIIEIYEKRIEDRDREIEALKKDQRKREKEKHHIIQSLKRSGLSTDKLIERYDKPLYSILISYATQVKPNSKGYYEPYKFIQKELRQYNVKMLGGADLLIPPTKVPRWIKNKNDLQAWFEKEILKGRYCKLKFLILFDLRKKAFWNNYVPYNQKKPFNLTLGEVLGIEDLFTEEQINVIALSDIIRDGDIVWLASRLLNGKELEIIHKNQSFIEHALGNPSLRQLSSESIVQRLNDVFVQCGIANADDVAKAIIDEAKFWISRLK